MPEYTRVTIKKAVCLMPRKFYKQKKYTLNTIMFYSDPLDCSWKTKKWTKWGKTVQTGTQDTCI